MNLSQASHNRHFVPTPVVLHQVGRCAKADDPLIDHDGYIVAQLLCLVHPVRRQNN